MEASMNTYEVITDVPEENTYHKITADECRWENVYIKEGNQTLVGKYTMLVFVKDNSPVAHFRVEHVVGWSIKQD